MQKEKTRELYGEHLSERARVTATALSETGFDRLVLHAGRPYTYHADDMDAPFHPNPHFAHWTPVEGPGHLLAFTPGSRPKLLRVAPRDFWYEPPAPAPDFVNAEIEVEEVGSPEEVWKRLPPDGRTAYVGNAPAEAEAFGLAADAVNPAPLVARLDWERAYKTRYEVECLAEATAKSARGHRAAEKAFREGGSEMEIHHAYVSAVGDMDEALPYPTIIGLDERAATLHYHAKRGRESAPGKVLLIDAGATKRGYGCDITRTYTTDGADDVFEQLVAGTDRLQQKLVALARPGKHYLDLHLDAHRFIAELLVENGVLLGGAEEVFAKGLTLPFFCHGLGHFLGIQVHDVAGRQVDREGTINAPPPEHPALRTTRPIEERHLFTIEPGIYFIPMLLDPHREGPETRSFNWPLIDRLIAMGGIRVEDNVFVTAEANRNLTREAL